MGNSLHMAPSELDKFGGWISKVVICPFTHCLYGFPEMAYLACCFRCTCDHSKHHNLGVFTMNYTTLKLKEKAFVWYI